MDDVRLGAAFRALRSRRRWTQAALATRARLGRTTVSRAERGHLDTLTLGQLRAIAAALEMRLDLVGRWRSGDLDRLVAAGHVGLHEHFLPMLRRNGWQPEAEVSFSLWGERGVIDILAWHPTSRTLLVVELKTILVDPGALVAQVDRYRRISPVLAQQRGWEPEEIGAIVVVRDIRTNRRRLAASAELLRTAFPSDGRTVGAWLRRPTGRLAGLMFLPDDL